MKDLREVFSTYQIRSYAQQLAENPLLRHWIDEDKQDGFLIFANQPPNDEGTAKQWMAANNLVRNAFLLEQRIEKAAKIEDEPQAPEEAAE